MVVHFPVLVQTSIKRGESFVEAKTGCGMETTGTIPRGGALIDIGLSGWSSDITCPVCRKRLKIEGDS